MVLSAETVWRDHATYGVPTSGAWKVRKREVREHLTQLENFITATTANGGLIYETRAQLYVDLAHAANTSAWVVADSTVAYNGIYRKVGGSGSGSWTRVADLPYSFIRLVDGGAGTANAIIATSSIPLPASPSAAILVMNVFEANTGNVTLAVNGAAAKPLVTSSGAQISASGLTVGANIAFVDAGTTFRLLSDQASAAVLAAAEAARDAAQAAASSVVPNVFATVAAAEAYAPAVAPDFLFTSGYSTAADGGGAVYKKVGSEPEHGAKFSLTQSGGGTVWYEDARRKIVIFASGQSNIANRPAYSWTPPSNLLLWDFWGQSDLSSDVGTEFARLDGAWISSAASFAAEVARNNPDALVCLIDISRGGTVIANWGETPPDYDYREAITGNVPAALAIIGVDRIDVLLWWQGEGDASLSNTNYITNFNDLHEWFREQEWWPYDTPIVMFGLGGEHATLAGVPTPVFQNYNGYILGCVAFDPATRMFVRPGIFPAAEYWDPSGDLPNIHMNAAGYLLAGRLAYTTWAYGIGRDTASGRIVNPTTGNLLEYGGGVPPTVPSVSEEWTFHRNQADTSNLNIKNFSTSASAQVHLNLMTDTGIFGFRATSNAGTKQAQLTWNIGGMLMAATDAASGTITFATGGFNSALTLRVDKAPIFNPPAGPTALNANGQVTFELTSNTTLTFRARGSDGVSRSGTLALA